MTHPTRQVVAFIWAWFVAMLLNHCVIKAAWRLMTARLDLSEKITADKLPNGKSAFAKIKALPAAWWNAEPFASSPFAPAVGWLEQFLYIASVMSHHYELAAGWLTMKAFSSWLSRERPKARACSGHGEDAALGKYNEYLVGNILSLLIGIFSGAIANLVVQMRLGANLDWTL